jgi:hypothetical protein
MFLKIKTGEFSIKREYVGVTEIFTRACYKQSENLDTFYNVTIKMMSSSIECCQNKEY